MSEFAKYTELPVPKNTARSNSKSQKWLTILRKNSKILNNLRINFVHLSHIFVVRGLNHPHRIIPVTNPDFLIVLIKVKSFNLRRQPRTEIFSIGGRLLPEHKHGLLAPGNQSTIVHEGESPHCTGMPVQSRRVSALLREDVGNESDPSPLVS